MHAVFGRRSLIGLNVSVDEGVASPEGSRGILPSTPRQFQPHFLCVAIVKSGCFLYPVSKMDMWYKRFLQTPAASLFLLIHPHNNLQPDHHTCVMTHMFKEHNSDHVISLHKTHQSTNHPQTNGPCLHSSQGSPFASSFQAWPHHLPTNFQTSQLYSYSRTHLLPPLNSVQFCSI